MKEVSLVLYSKEGCCLCEGLKKKVESLPLDELEPAVIFYVVDINGNKVSAGERGKYTLEVPVMFFVIQETLMRVELPRVSPRTKAHDLFVWLQKELTIFLTLD